MARAGNNLHAKPQRLNENVMFGLTSEIFNLAFLGLEYKSLLPEIGLNLGLEFKLRIVFKSFDAADHCPDSKVCDASWEAEHLRAEGEAGRQSQFCIPQTR